MGIGAALGGLVSGAGSLFGASETASALKKAAAIQAQTAQQAMAQQLAMFEQTQANEKPYLDVGSQAAGQLGNRLTDLTTPINFTAPDISDPTNRAALAPGYDFTLNQGLKATQNAAAAKGLGISGAALKGASSYATGLADQTYNDVFNRAQQSWQDQVTNQGNAFNRLYQTAGLGASTSVGQGNTSAAVGNNVANNLISSGNAQASGILGAASATTSGITGATTAFNNALQQYLAQGNSLNGLFSSSDSGVQTPRGSGTDWSNA